MKKFFVGLILLGILTGLLAGCGKEKDPADTTASENDVTTTTPQTSDLSATDTLKEHYDFDQNYVIMSRESTKYEFDVSNGTAGDAVETALYKRQTEVEKRANVTIQLKTFAGDWDKYADGSVSTMMRANANAGTSEFDLLSTHGSYTAALVTDGFAYDMAKAPNMDFGKVWWSSEFYKNCNYNGAVYFMYGHICYTLYEYIEVCFYNEAMMSALDANLDLYDLALDGEWTFQELKQYTQMAGNNLDDPERAVYGLLDNDHGNDAFMSAFDIELFPVSNGKRVANVSLSENDSNRAQAFVDWITQSDFIYKNEDYGVENKLFASGNGLFYISRLGESLKLKNMMSESYGVLPFPKYDGNQVSYRTVARNALSAVMIPSNVADIEMVGTVTELLCMEGYFKTTNTYYEKILKRRAFNNPKCIKTLDLIIQSFNPSFEYVYNCILGDGPICKAASLMSHTINSTSGHVFSNKYTKFQPDWFRLLGEFYDKMDDIILKSEL